MTRPAPGRRCAAALLVILPLASGFLYASEYPPEVQALLERARSVPAEFAADALIRIANSDKVRDKDAKRDLLEEAFQRAAAAQHPYKMRALGARRGTRTGFLGRAYAQNLDVTSLQARAVKSTLAVDKRKARELFAAIPPPQLPRLKCDDRLVHDLSLFYTTLADVVNTTFTPAEIEKDEPLKFAQRYLVVTSPAQVSPMASALASMQLRKPQLEALLATFSSSLKELAGDDRSFFADAKTSGPAVLRLAAACKSAEIPTYALLEAYRSYLARHSKADHCPVIVEPVGGSFAFSDAERPDPTSENALAYFNLKLRFEVYPPGGEVAGIADSEITPATAEDQAPAGCASPQCRQLASQYRSLIVSPEGIAYSNEQRAASEWQARMKEYLARLADWKDDSSASSAEQFFQKCEFYSDLANLVPNGPDRDTILRAFLGFLRQTSYQQEDRLEWFLPVNTLAGRVVLDRAGLANLFDELKKNGEPVMRLYLELDLVVTRSPAEILSLL